MKTLRLTNLVALSSAVFCILLSVPARAGTVQFTLTKTTPQVSYPILSGYGAWSFSFVSSGRISSFSRQIKNYSPGAGDICWARNIKQPKGSGNDITSYADGTPQNIPQAVAQACGTRWHDPDDALYLYALIDTADSNARVDVTVTFPDYPVVAALLENAPLNKHVWPTVLSYRPTTLPSPQRIASLRPCGYAPAEATTYGLFSRREATRAMRSATDLV